MAQSFTTPNGTLIVPDVYSTVQVQQGVAGAPTAGVIFLVGEADKGPDFTLEADLSQNSFGPGQLSDVVAKYGSGGLVDAFVAAAVPANDPKIVGSPSAFIFVKTNVSTKATANLTATNAGVYAPLYDTSYGKLGNLIYFTVSAKTAEVQPTTGAFTFIPPVGTAALSARVNGGAELAHTAAANETPAAFQAALAALAGGLSCTGGADRHVLTSTHGDLAVGGVVGNSVLFSLSVIASWDNQPSVGDTLVVPLGSVVAGAASANVGAYVVTAVSSTSISATKLSDAGKGGAVPGVVTAPAAVSAVAVAGAEADLVCYASVVLTLSATTVVDGVGKSLEINQLTTGTDLVSRCLYVLGTTGAVTWLSTSASPKLLTSASEYAAQLNTSRQVDGVTEQLSAGGKIALQVGYSGSTCAVTVGPTTLATAVAGGAGTNLSLDLTHYPTLADLAAYINAQPGYNAKVGSNAIGQMSPLALDEATFGAATTWGNPTLRLKVDAASFFTAVSASVLVQLNNPAKPAACGLPAVAAAPVYLAGGLRGGTSDAGFNAGVDALKALRGNFVVPCFSRDATLDITDGATDSTSTYTIANVQAYAKSHCLAMSTLKKKRNRQAFLAQRDTIANDEDAAAVLASARCSLCVQDVKISGPQGIVQGQPHVLAALAAGMSAAAGYKGIVKKGLNCTGLVFAAGGWTDQDDDDREAGLVAGLLFAERDEDGGFTWVSDQTTYSRDNNFVYNSVQAVYVTDLISLTCASRMAKAFGGENVADVDGALILAALESIMSDFLRLKWIAVSDDAPKGFKNPVVKIVGGAWVVSCEVKLAGILYWGVINFLVSPVQQTVSG